MSHTPGSWHVRGPYGAVGTMEVWGEMPVCTVSYYKDDRWEANAWLIAAAPELLEACKQLINDMAYDDDGDVFLCKPENSSGDDNDDPPAITAILEAIAKAQLEE